VRLRQIVVLVFLSLLLVTHVAGQSPNATISGLVVDPSGAVIVAADVLVANDATGVQYSAKTNGEGIYLVSNLLPGTYRLQISKIGFKTIIKPDITLHVQDALAINFTLPIGATSEIVTVHGGAPLVSTESGAVSTVIDQQFVENVPLNGRSFNTLLQLTPGVVITPSGSGASGSPGQFSIAGQRTDANTFTVDGVSANFGVGPGFPDVGSGTGTAQAFSALGGTSSLVSVDSLQEFRIETSSFAPEFGGAPGGQVILTTRSGTNDFHGGLYDYFRNTVLDANDWFNDARNPPLPKAPEHHNDFGGFLGGPLRKNESFFFASYEGARLEQPQSEVYQVPSTYARAQASTTLAPFLNAFPQPNATPTSPTAYIAPFDGSFSNSARLDAGSMRIDHTFDTKFSIFGRYNNAPSELVTRNESLPNNPANVTVNTQTLTLGMNASLNARISNAFRANYSTQSSSSVHTLDSFGGAQPLPVNLLMGDLSPQTTYASFETLDTFHEYIVGPDARNHAMQLNFTDDLSWTVGVHELKFGGNYRTVYLDSNPSQNQLWFTADSIPSFLSTEKADSLFARTLIPTQILSRTLELYGQDTWKATSRITLTYGLRWGVYPAPSGRGTTTLSAWTSVDNPAALSLAPIGTPLWNTTYGNVAPRFGIAYRLNAKGDFILRAGGGVFYDPGFEQAAQLGTSFPNYASGFFSDVPLPVSSVASYLPVLSREPPFPTGILGFAPDLTPPRSYQWDVALEKSFGGREAISATYVGQAGRDLLRQEALYQPNSNFAGDFLLWEQDAYSNYNSLQLQFRKPLSSRLEALASYSWSHSLDNASNDVVAGLSNTILSGASDYSSSDFDVRQSFSGALTYTIPELSGYKLVSIITKDWSFSSVIVARAGFPFNGVVVFASPDPGGYASSRPDLVPGQPLWIPNATAPGGRSLNPSAFSVPSIPRQGTEGRNDIPGFGLTQADFSIGRKFAMSEPVNLEFRVDAFNALNHPNFANPPALVEFGPAYLESGEMLNQSLGGLIPIFQEGGPRSLQLSLKLTF
jgi:hypothetical protein